MKSKLLAFDSAVMAFQFSFANPGPDDLPREWAIGGDRLAARNA